MSVTNLTRVSALKENVDALANAMRNQIKDLPSAINFSKSIDSTEHYGRSARASSGFVDLYDLTQNIQDTYRALSNNIKTVQNSLKAAIIYTVYGEAKPNANGLSVYMPLSKEEYSNQTELFSISPDWLILINIQKSMIETDTLPPVIKSVREEGDSVKARVYGSDISNIFAQTLTNSTKGYNLIYTQNIEPSLIDDQGFFQYKKHKMLELCNETTCIPVTMKLKVNKDKKFVFIPIRLESTVDKINEDVMILTGNLRKKIMR